MDACGADPIGGCGGVVVQNAAAVAGPKKVETILVWLRKRSEMARVSHSSISMPLCFSRSSASFSIVCVSRASVATAMTIRSAPKGRRPSVYRSTASSRSPALNACHRFAWYTDGFRSAKKATTSSPCCAWPSLPYRRTSYPSSRLRAMASTRHSKDSQSISWVLSNGGAGSASGGGSRVGPDQTTSSSGIVVQSSSSITFLLSPSDRTKRRDRPRRSLVFFVNRHAAGGVAVPCAACFGENGGGGLVVVAEGFRDDWRRGLEHGQLRPTLAQDRSLASVDGQRDALAVSVVAVRPHREGHRAAGQRGRLAWTSRRATPSLNPAADAPDAPFLAATRAPLTAAWPAPATGPATIW
jgi:hypothetical protein